MNRKGYDSISYPDHGHVFTSMGYVRKNTLANIDFSQLIAREISSEPIEPLSIEFVCGVVKRRKPA